MGFSGTLDQLDEFLHEQADREYVITRVFKAPRNRVWKAWTDQAELKKWWGPKQFSNPVCEIDLRPGGSFHIVMRSPEGMDAPFKGPLDFPFRGTYQEIVPLERLVMTGDVSEHPPGWFDLVNKGRTDGATTIQPFLWTVTFEDCNGDTKVTISYEFGSAADRNAMVGMGMSEGWASSFENLDELLEPTSIGN
jgi:uncharacterized protein YndB with AHSA1/START domain